MASYPFGVGLTNKMHEYFPKIDPCFRKYKKDKIKRIIHKINESRKN